MTSSTSSSNYGNLATYDPNNPGLAVSNYSIPHRFTWRLSYEAYWWGENRTKISLFGAANQDASLFCLGGPCMESTFENPLAAFKYLRRSTGR